MIFESLRDEESRVVFIEAMATDLILKTCHLSCLAKLDCRLKSEITRSLLPAVGNIDRMGGFDVVLDARSGDRLLQTDPRRRNASLRLLLFNPECASAHYLLDLSDPPDRCLCDRLLLINEWEGRRAEAARRPDLSQYGNFENMRNCVLSDAAGRSHSV